MSADLPHLQGPHRAIALLSDSERIAWIRQERWIQYGRAERILDILADLVDYPPRDRMPSMVIYGATGMGKTRIVQKFLRDHRSRFVPRRHFQLSVSLSISLRQLTSSHNFACSPSEPVQCRADGECCLSSGRKPCGPSWRVLPQCVASPAGILSGYASNQLHHVSPTAGRPR